MQNILFPTDFSENSAVAQNCAKNICQRTGSAMHVLHCVHIPIIDPNMPVNMMASLDYNLQRETNEKLQKICSELAEGNPKISCKAVVRTGFAAEEIAEYAASNNIDLIIMGTKGAGGTEEILGSIASIVIEKTDVAVLAIPGRCSFNNNYAHIVYATDLSEKNLDPVIEVLDFARFFDSEVTLLHVSEKGELSESEQDTLNHIRKGINRNMNFEIRKGDDVLDEIEKYIYSHDINVIAMAYKKRSFFERIFSRSLTRNMSFHTEIPLLVVHK
jgi:nucleotide-binding universal stress UspA family protein